MFCTTAPVSKPAPRVRRGSTLDAMVETIREQRLLTDCVTKDDLARAGFTPGEIAAHGEAAVARVRREMAAH